MFGGQLRDHVRRNRRCVAKRLIEIPRQVLDDLNDIGPKHQVVVIRAELRSDGAGVRQLVEAGFLETDRKRLEASGGGLGHHRHDGARVDAAAEKGSDRNVADLVEHHRLVQQGAQLFDEFGFGRGLIGLERDVPVPLDVQRPARRMPRRRAPARAFGRRRRCSDPVVSRGT